jgi:hypothetical protein
MRPDPDHCSLSEIPWEPVDVDLPTRWQDESTIAAEVESRFEAFKAGRERGLTHEEVFGADRSIWQQ